MSFLEIKLSRENLFEQKICLFCLRTSENLFEILRKMVQIFMNFFTAVTAESLEEGRNRKTN